MSWDDAGNDDPVLMDSWDAEVDFAGDEPIMDSWDAEPEEQEKKKDTKPKAGKKNAKDDKNKKKEPGLLAIDTLDEKTRKELLKKAEIESDLNNAADLLGDLEMAGEHPAARALQKERELAAQAALLRPALTKDTPIEDHPLFKAETKLEYQDLRKALSTAIVSKHEQSPLNYSSSLTIDLIRDISKPMTIENIRQTVATLNILIKDKEKAERQARLARVKGGTATGGAGKKKVKAKTNLGGAFKKDQDFDVDNFDDFGDDDFM
ncbi:Eukaryotic translation initiation factor 3 subunit J [Nakaseomyces bracarensis]|uniref:Eukaryotic translation initiation factor 3 subunit J n=1 Tax=Nakaseomyces bracarensis TaxID=273131 RepID=A0ABR4NUP9_9SACH